MLHQYHLPSDGVSLPSGWKQYLKDYNEHFFIELPEFNGLKELDWPRKRASLDMVKNGNLTVKKLFGRRLYIRHCILNDIVNQKIDEPIKYEIELSDYLYPNNSTAFKFMRFFNTLLSSLNLPFKLESLFKEQYLDKKDVYDEIYFLLKSLENSIADYYLNHFENKIILVIIKK
jgi:hypothetical protein